MAIDVTTQRTIPAPFIEGASKAFIDQLTKAVGQYKGADLSKAFGSQFIAGQDPLEKQAQDLAQSGIGSYEQFLNRAKDAQAQAGILSGEAQQFVGPQAYKQFMSPYQRDVIDTTLLEFDRQSAKGIPGIAAQAVGAGVLGGGREGVMRAEYGASSDRNRAALQAQLLGQAFGQAQQAANQAFGQQLGLANQQANLGQAQLGLGSAIQGFQGRDIAGLASFGSQNRALEQQRLLADQQLAQARLNQPLTAAKTLGSGITGIVSAFPGASTQQITSTPDPSLAQTALGTGATLAGIYRGFGLGG